MKVCVVGTRGFPGIEGGVEKHCECIYPLLQEKAEITVFRRKPYVQKDQECPGIQFVDLPSTMIKGVEALLHSFLATVCAIARKPDVMHYHNIGPALFSLLPKLFGIPVVMTYHSPNYEHKKWGFFAKNLLKFCEWVALHCSDRIIFVNRFQMQKYPAWILEKSVYIPNGIQAPVLSGRMDCLKKYDLEPGRYILSVGRITPEKGFHTLVRGFRTAELEGVKLVIAGGVEAESGYMTQLRTLSAGLPVEFTGAVFGEELAQLYANAALFVLASENEGFPLVLLEAMSHKRNVLVSDIPATRLVDLSPGDYFPSGDWDVLANSLRQKLKEDPVRNYDLSGFDWQTVAESVMNMYRELVSRKME